MSRKVRLILAASMLLFAVPLFGDETPEPLEPVVAGASDEPQAAMQSIRLPDGFGVELFAAEPVVANPVCFAFDERGRVYVCETFRQSKGIEDNRAHMDWLDDDLAAQTVEDRLAYLRKRLGDRVQDYTKFDDRVRLLADTDGDLLADRATVFANRFNGILDGTGAGILSYRGNVYFTCIPELWLLRDENDDGQADVRRSLHHGFGVRFAFRGHDLHGLRIGPDGKLYFSVGDRGYNIDLGDRNLVNPDSGAVFRCNLDGSALEVIATGLRNPQELAFDQFGNLFTGDNNSDSGDRARWVYVVEGMDAGWRMYYQYLPDRGPWNQEQLWHPRFDGQAAYIVPPIAHIGDGPSGLTYDPGVGLPERWRSHFFMADFRGSASQSGIRAISVKPQGATFEIADSQEFIWSVLATDVEFSPAGELHLSDWVEGWDGPGKGRIYRFPTRNVIDQAARFEAAGLISTGLTGRSVAELAALLKHPDMRVRLEAQFALVSHGADAAPLFEAAVHQREHRLARLHGIWGLGMLSGSMPGVTRRLIAYATDDDDEVRSQLAKVWGDACETEAAQALVTLLGDPSLRVRSFSAIALGKLASASAAQPLLTMLAENADHDPVLRHAGAMGLAGCLRPEQLIDLATHPSASARLGIALALRRHRSALLARFLADSDPLIVAEAARAIHDLPVDAALADLAALADQPGLSEPVLRRVLNANYRLGDAAHASNVARIAASPSAPVFVRVEALRALEAWKSPAGRDRLLGAWRPLPMRDDELAAAALRPVLSAVFAGPDRVRRAAARAAAALGVKEVGPALLSLLGDETTEPQSRAEALSALAAIREPSLAEAVNGALRDGSAEVRAEARAILVKLEPSRALDELEHAIQLGEAIERQAALASLAKISDPRVDAILGQALDQLLDGTLPEEVRLDVLNAAAVHKSETLSAKLSTYEAALNSADPLSTYRVCLTGGNAERGAEIVFNRGEVSCLRCHKINGRGGDVGPDLTKAADMKPREYLLEAIVQPSRQIAKGYESATVLLDDGRTLTGVVRGETETTLQLLSAEGKLLTIDKARIEERAEGVSAMPDTVPKYLSKAEIRDLVEYLSTLK